MNSAWGFPSNCALVFLNYAWFSGIVPDFLEIVSLHGFLVILPGFLEFFLVFLSFFLGFLTRGHTWVTGSGPRSESAAS